ncbi:type II toxin-antitoxin system VapC family toxin [Devosia aurantiaca]|uniref:Type II toxin-antitoxin system VapC family toxin n=1 Tax=Devosia aurantiaca TaxID=2714858 RepID=A0A6M1SMJ5_9HYPH|nr:type II toxin-antitoxin system VapC family toxin [Devosia aurantiaca]NGP18350.1 type II toxin-antitoxin system VapC family toxin [Devosia aurantiaca]
MPLHIYLDTNIIIRMFEARDHDDVAKYLLDVLIASNASARSSIVTSQLALAEVLVHPIRDGNQERQEDYLWLLGEHNAWIDTVPIQASILIEAARLRATSKLKLPDAIHLATATLYQCEIFLTEDLDFRAATNIDVVRPDQDGLAQLSARLEFR